MNLLFFILAANFLISLFSLIGVFTLSLKEKFLERVLLLLVSLSAGALMGGAFLHLIPESLEKIKNGNPFIFTLFGFILFFIIEKIFHWRHCHKGHCDIHTFGYLNLIGDSLHNFLDGLIIASTFLINFNLGIITSLNVALHEIPQEIGDFGVLVYAGIKKEKALFLNFLVALFSVFGGLTGYFLSSFSPFSFYLLPIAAGGFIYIAASDLMPELRKEKSLKKSLFSFLVFISGILINFLMKEK